MIGIDIVFLNEFKKQARQGGEAFLEKVFLHQELKNDNLEHLAGVFAAKEAVTKALSLDPGAWQEIFITYKSSGQPYAIVNQRNIAISIAHHGDYAVAVAVEGDNDKT